jgi:hypothetical protein
VFLADDTAGLTVVGISDPSNPTLFGNFDTPDRAFGVTVDGNHAFVADANGGLQVIEVFQRSFNQQDNVGYSLAVDARNDTIRQGRLTTTQLDSIRWELSADGGSNWQDVTPNGGWNVFVSPGVDLLWRSTHVYTGGVVNPSCTSLEIEWMYDFAVIETIEDIPNDQGKQARLTWARSANDDAASSRPITQYAIFREIDPNLSAQGEWVDHRRRHDYPIDLLSPQHLAFMPPGWDFITTVPAFAEDGYSTVVPTLRDSTITDGIYNTTFLVRAATATPSNFFDSPPDSGYSVDNLAPFIPQGFGVAYNTGSGNQLSWDPSDDADFQYFRIYRSTDPNFTPTPGDLIHSTTDTNWLDGISQAWQYNYKITATDFSGNESGPASPNTVTATPSHVIPTHFALHQSTPNPFNPATAIRYDVPAPGGRVTVKIYDVSGRLIRTLLDDHQTPGQKKVVWDGSNDIGQEAASGVYFYRMQAPNYEKTLKMILVK